MKSVGQLLVGLITAMGSIVLIIAAASLSVLEGAASLPAAITSEPTRLVSTPATPTTPLQLTPVSAEPTRPALLPTATVVQPTSCPIPSGWTSYLVQPGDTLEELAQSAGITTEKVREANCLTVSSLYPNTILYLPLKATATVSAPATPTPLPTVAVTVAITPAPTLCAPPRYWVPYIVRSGDTLYSLGVSVGLSADALRNANCMTGDYLQAGQVLYLPFIPARPSTPTRTATISPATDTPIPAEPTRTSAPTITPTFTFTPTFTSPPTFTFTPTFTAIPSATLTPSLIPTATNTAVEVGVNTVTPAP